MQYTFTHLPGKIARNLAYFHEYLSTSNNQQTIFISLKTIDHIIFPLIVDYICIIVIQIYATS